MAGRKELNWLSSHPEEIEQYMNRWIAIHEDRVIAVGDSVKDVMDQVKRQDVKILPLVTLVPSKDEAPYVMKEEIDR